MSESSGLFRRINPDMLTVRISNILQRYCLLVDGDIALRSIEELDDLRQIGRVQLDTIEAYASLRGFDLRPQAILISTRLNELYGGPRSAPISSISIIHRNMARLGVQYNDVNSWAISKLIKSGKQTIGQLDRSTPEEIAQLLGREFSASSALITDLFSALSMFYEQLRF